VEVGETCESSRTGLCLWSGCGNPPSVSQPCSRAMTCGHGDEALEGFRNWGYGDAVSCPPLFESCSRHSPYQVAILVCLQAGRGASSRADGGTVGPGPCLIVRLLLLALLLVRSGHRLDRRRGAAAVCGGARERAKSRTGFIPHCHHRANAAGDAMSFVAAVAKRAQLRACPQRAGVNAVRSAVLADQVGRAGSLEG
jgi:hypothetical protein